MLLQFGGPDGVSTVGLLVQPVILVAVATVLGYLVDRDARARGDDRATLWGLSVGLGTVLFVIPGLVVLATYVFFRQFGHRFRAGRDTGA